MNKHKIIFFGTPNFAVKSLEKLREKFNVVAVVTAVDKPQGRHNKIIPSPIKEYALENSLHLLQPEKLRDEDKSIDEQLNINKETQKDLNEKITELMSIYDSLYEEYKANVYNFSYLEEIFQKYQDLVDRLTYEAFVFSGPFR